MENVGTKKYIYSVAEKSCKGLAMQKYVALTKPTHHLIMSAMMSFDVAISKFDVINDQIVMLVWGFRDFN